MKKERWEKISEGGKKKYIISEGIAFGVLGGIASRLVMWLILNDPETAQEAFFSLDFLLHMLFFFGGGFGYAAIMWTHFNNKFGKKGN